MGRGGRQKIKEKTEETKPWRKQENLGHHHKNTAGIKKGPVSLKGRRRGEEEKGSDISVALSCSMYENWELKIKRAIFLNLFN